MNALNYKDEKNEMSHLSVKFTMILISLNNHQIEVIWIELVNELEVVPSNSTVIVERVPIEFADFTFRLVNQAAP